MGDTGTLARKPKKKLPKTRRGMGTKRAASRTGAQTMPQCSTAGQHCSSVLSTRAAAGRRGECGGRGLSGSVPPCCTPATPRAVCGGRQCVGWRSRGAVELAPKRRPGSRRLRQLRQTWHTVHTVLPMPTAAAGRGFPPSAIAPHTLLTHTPQRERNPSKC